jgi:serine/threonine protein phosphatase 1
MKNYWIIGDIHGEIRLLDRLLNGIRGYNPDQIVFVGDYIDRGPCSKEVIDRIMGLENETVCLMGNHEMMMLNAMEDMGYVYSPVELWYYNGGEATLHSFGFTSFFSFRSDMEPFYVAFFRSLKMSHTIHLGNGLKILVTHAGISPAIPVVDQLRMNSYDELNRYLLGNHIDPGNSFLWVRDAFFSSASSLWEGYLVVHGHTPVLKLKSFISAEGQKQYLFMENDLCIRRDETNRGIASIDIDSGSVISGRLSGLGFFIEDGRPENPSVRMRSLTVSDEEIFPRDLGLINVAGWAD